MSEICSEPNQTPKMEIFAKMVNRLKLDRDISQNIVLFFEVTQN